MTQPFILPHRERRRLHERAYRAQQRAHEEVCGALVADRAGRLELQFLTNHSQRPGHFEIERAEFRAARAAAARRGMRVVGSFHSHPVGYVLPSPADLKLGPLGSLLLLYDVCGRQARLWRLRRRGRRRVAREAPLWQEPRPRAPTRQPTARWSRQALTRMLDAPAAERER